MLCSLDPDGEKIVKASKQKHGIAIIVNCDYSDTWNLSTLLGTNKDAEEMETLNVLRFHTITLRNPAQSEITIKIWKISSALLLLEEVNPVIFRAIQLLCLCFLGMAVILTPYFLKMEKN